MKREALGMIETYGLAAMIAAADGAAKTADVQIYTYEKADAGIMTVYIAGDVAAVSEAVEAGASIARSMGKLLHRSVIPGPAADVLPLIKPRQQSAAGQAKKPRRSTAGRSLLSRKE
ncbi:BMC domain-containing protein [Paenibacillus spongiae]|uniref:BMC domain-containing protein n=1 Tax=Paenibacillus spongiae TaxID=2909671 RepID=A0ABY5SA27_9BACL|nr:BMC domain-containing protein [Paenibacillus spongiae]UVI30509.1 BMC domain-containing protein [Paenibacillus spongiae]